MSAGTYPEPSGGSATAGRLIEPKSLASLLNLLLALLGLGFRRLYPLFVLGDDRPLVRLGGASGLLLVTWPPAISSPALRARGVATVFNDRRRERGSFGLPVPGIRLPGRGIGVSCTCPEPTPHTALTRRTRISDIEARTAG